MTPALQVTTDDPRLAAIVDWAIPAAREHAVDDGDRGPLDVSELTPRGRGEVAYRASYRAGYSHRSGYYARDFAHQALGAHLLGLRRHNAGMLESFLMGADEAHGGWPIWAYNFDRATPLAIDYDGPHRFVRELPAAFELIETAHALHRWTGAPVGRVELAYAVRTVTAFVDAHDLARSNGVAEGTGRSIFDGVASYNERPDVPLRESGDGFASQYAATRHAASLARAAGAVEAVVTLSERAERLRSLYATTWSRGLPEVVCGWTTEDRPVDAWCREGTWFPALKGLLDHDDDRTQHELTRIDALSRDPATAPRNIEALTYLPDLYLRHGMPDVAFDWMLRIFALRDEPHEVAAQGRNGSYPEVSFTLVAQTVAGLLGLAPDAARRILTTRPLLPAGVRRLAVTGIPFGDGRVSVAFADGITTLENHTGETLQWNAGSGLRSRFVDPHLTDLGGVDRVLRVEPGRRASHSAER